MPRIKFNNMPYKKIVDTGEHVVISGGYYSPDPDYKDDESIYCGYHTYDSFGLQMQHIMEFDKDGKIVRVIELDKEKKDNG